MEHELLTTRDLAARLGVARKTVRAWARHGRVPVYHLSRNQLRFDWEEVVGALKAERADTNGALRVDRGERAP